MSRDNIIKTLENIKNKQDIVNNELDFLKYRDNSFETK